MRKEPLQIIALVAEVRAHLAQPLGDFLWTSWRDQAQALQEVDAQLALLQQGIVPPYLAGLFVPTGPVQEHSLSNGWGPAFLDLACRFELAMSAWPVQAEFLTETSPWHQAEVLQLGEVLGASSIVARVGITLADGGRLRVDLPASGYSCFQDVRCESGRVWIGHGDVVVVVHPDRQAAEVHVLAGYFGALYTPQDLEASPPPAFAMLAASASELLCFGADGRLCWRTADLGIDGVIVHAVRDGTVRGAGEWDPPGGWEDFRLRVDTGEIVAGSSG